MEMILIAVAYIIAGFASAFYFRWVGSWFIEGFDSGDAAIIIVMWPVYWLFYILKIVCTPFVLIVEMIFD